MRGSAQVLSPSGITPRRTCTMPYLASRAMNRRSQCRVMVKPIPMAWPFTAAMTGLRICHAGGDTGLALNDVDSERSNTWEPPEKSAPAQNAGGVPVITTTRTASSVSARR